MDLDAFGRETVVQIPDPSMFRHLHIPVQLPPALRQGPGVPLYDLAHSVQYGLLEVVA